MNTETVPATGALLRVAEQLLAAGISGIPIKADGTKAPAIRSWDPYKERLPTPAEEQRWFAKGSRGIAAVCGAVSGGLEALDFDLLSIFDPWRGLVDEEMPGLVDRLTRHRTPRPGATICYRCSQITGNTKLAQVPEKDPKTGKIKPKTIIETRGEGGYFLIPGCPPGCHETGRLYEHIGGPPLSQVATITPEERECLWRAARSFNQCVAAQDICEEPKTRSRDGRLRPGDDFSNRGPDWEQIIGPHGWTETKPGYWRRPGKAKSWSATTGYCKTKDGYDLFANFSTNAHPFEGPRGDGKPCTCYTKFAAYTLLSHGGDFTAAAKDLATQGYGDQTYKNNGAAHDTTPTGIHLTDMGNAIRLVKRHGLDLHHCHSWHKWLVWNQSQWQEDAVAAATYRAKEMIASLVGWAANMVNEINKELKDGANGHEATEGTSCQGDQGDELGLEI